MVMQERAERTQCHIVNAAASEFARHGYNGTSLARISKAAGVTMGALTFHFPAKSCLADAVCAHGSATTRDAAEHAGLEGEPPLQRVITLTHTLARLLHEDDTVRAAGRLSHESATAQPDWRTAWMPEVRQLLWRAREEKSMRASAEPEVVAAFVACLVSDLEAAARRGGDHTPGSRHLLSEIWDLVLPRIAAGVEPLDVRPPEGPR
ncbi:TetR family transcriptional regulator [Streptomyces sp. NPDC050161]|uniref:TetR family transcriptional regulator n=1 Tax=Streptomyces sp. NPDC050161 TaxID=3365604 RepID=UPI003796CE14